MRTSVFVAFLCLLAPLLMSCAGSVGDTRDQHPPPFNKAVNWYDDYTLSANACWRTNSIAPNCPGL